MVAGSRCRFPPPKTRPPPPPYPPKYTLKTVYGTSCTERRASKYGELREPAQEALATFGGTPLNRRTVASWMPVLVDNTIQRAKVRCFFLSQFSTLTQEILKVSEIYPPGTNSRTVDPSARDSNPACVPSLLCRADIFESIAARSVDNLLMPRSPC